jgi:serine/threonine-protein kinase
MTGDVIAGRYRLLEPLGRGAMSSVWLAEDAELQRRVAVKTLVPTADRARFDREARAVASLSHPNICALYDYGSVDGKPYMVLEYLPNGSLEERLAATAILPDDETLRVATEIAAGLAHAHSRGLVHRDLKPANVLFDAEGRAKIADFGIARMGGSGTLTEIGTVLGTASYLSPEQATGSAAGPASDVYSFGVILFRMLTGRLPFVSSNAMDLVRMHRDDTPPRVAEFRPDAPRRLETIATASLAKDPATRPADGAALLSALQGGPVHDSGEATAVLAVPPGSRRRRVAVAGAAGGVVLLAAGAAVALIAASGGNAPPTVESTHSLSLPTVATTALTTAPTTEPTTSGATAEPTTATTSATVSTATTATTTAAATTTPGTTTTPVTTGQTTATIPATTTVPPTTETAPGTTTTTTPDTTTAIGP